MIKDFSVSIICKDSRFKICQSEDYTRDVSKGEMSAIWPQIISKNNAKIGVLSN